MSGEGQGERSLRGLLFVLPAVATVAFAVVLALAVIVGNRNAALLRQVQEGYQPAFELSRDLEDDLAHIQQDLQNAVAASEEDDLVRSDKERDRALGRLQSARGNPVLQAAELERLATDFTGYHGLARATSLKLVRKEAGEDVGADLEAMRTRYNAVRDELRQFRERQRSSMDEAFAAATASQDQAVRTMTVTIVLCVLALLLLAQRLSGAITRPLQAAVEEAVRAAQSMAGGDLTVRVQARAMGEVQPLIAAMDGMGASVRRVIGEAKQGAEEVAAAASQILVSTRETVESAQQQAAAVQETIATASELQATVRVTEERAREIQGVVARTSRSGGEIRGRLGEAAQTLGRTREELSAITEALNDLARRNSQIGDIIDSVADVAEQTQLLAVNAGIEAAKAGDFGRGFSVVAAEMKGLADQSKKASQRIRRIVAEVQEAAAEAGRVLETGRSRIEASVRPMADVLPLVEQLTVEVEESSLALRQILGTVSQQVGGITQITQAMSLIERAVQDGLERNRGLASGAESLDRLGGQLRGVVASYRLN